MALLAGAFILVVAVAVFVRRHDLAKAQALVLGGSILPGCVIAEAVVLLAIGIAIVLVGLNVLT